MDQKRKSAAPGREYIDFDPDTQLVTEVDCDTLHVVLPGFTKEQLRLQLTTAQTLRIMGERPLANNRWLRLQREYPISTNCDTSRISAKFDNGILYARQPKLVLYPAVKGEKSETQKAVIEAPKPDQKSANYQPRPQKPASEVQKANEKPADDQPRPQKPDQKPVNDHPQPQQTNDQETKSTVDPSKQKEGKKSESVDDGSVGKGDLEREKGKMRETSEGQESRGRAGGRAPPLVAMGSRPMGKLIINLVVGILLVLVIGIYARNWMKALPWSTENES
ncbi:inactive protein RESTRICTED TEV MOVEMENT 2-like isoform X2 [Rhododendron vialii]|uniref:inactive protein RESTRICTED TEV MOVEMENT 2-like isoform X2 n=1 Tax=Rhododendron vialii TaxID=182163 RepID=UPI00265F602B|nr:inactive protein RESTRICTED TEV MOVEMENT 2-like isoform X2 [Rhododendron vialii]